MSLRDLRTKYGNPKAKVRQAINVAIRAEMVGGEDLLDALDKVSRLTTRLEDRGFAGAADARSAVAALIRLRSAMERIIRERYGMPIGDDREDA